MKRRRSNNIPVACSVTPPDTQMETMQFNSSSWGTTAGNQAGSAQIITHFIKSVARLRKFAAASHRMQNLPVAAPAVIVFLLAFSLFRT